MNHEFDYDRDYNREDELSKKSLRQILQMSLERENEMMKTYLITAERNAKRSRQLMDELSLELSDFF
ncbi:hypothetical protein MOF32_28065 [Priestia megaterium]|jgi:hypothetical protein|uniref:hypothetical protein n=1 Tax=Priestia megaterium TaxID=1404 RepID=UPI00227E6CA0|nr:hypothetical protein [Priestia megaterium]MCY9018232.1 hypothetical protein [Priestia megaterium]MCY9026737.1 hypothetical protein [Priestia megaterium]